MSELDEAMLRIIAAVARAKRLGPRDQKELQLEFDSDPSAFIDRYRPFLESLQKDVELFTDKI